MMEANELLVSVVIPAYGRSELIQDAIASCAQSRASLAIEIIVVDDASPESLEPLVTSQGVVFRRLPENAGSSAARNVGFALAQGRYVKFLDSDDVLTEGALAGEVNTAEITGADIVVANWRNVTLFENGGVRVDSSHSAPSFRSIPDDLLAGRAVPTGAALYRRTSVQDVRWDARLSKLNDWDYFVQAALASTKIFTCDAISYDWRAHQGERITSSSSFLKNADEFYVILNKLIDSLDSVGQLTEARKRRAAQYLYKELRGLYRFDRHHGRTELRRILSLDPDFVPMDEEHSVLFRAFGQASLLSPALEAYGWGRSLVDRIPALFR